jgi:uncharacterized protein YfaS (alpha-2-macroglobulin family)
MLNRISRILAVGTVGVMVSLATAARADGQVAEHEATPLRVVQSAPIGPTTSDVTQAWIEFSEPMSAVEPGEAVALPDWLHVTPALPVTLRWTRSSLLAITPVSGVFPYDRRFTIRVDAGARALSGARLQAAVESRFTTPAVSMSVYGQRTPGGRVEVTITTSQPLRPEDVAAYTTVRYHPFTVAAPALSPEARRLLTRVDPAAPARFDAAVRAMRARAAWTHVVPTVRLPSPGPRTIVLATREVPPPGTRLFAGPRPTEAERRRRPSGVDPAASRTIILDVPFFLTRAECGGDCAPDAVTLKLTQPVDARVLRRALHVRDVTDPKAVRELTPAPIGGYLLTVTSIDLTRLGFPIERGRRYTIVVDGTLTSEAGQRLPSAWASVVTTGLLDAFVTLSTRRDAVFEAGLGPGLPVVARNLGDILTRVSAVPAAELPRALASVGAPPTPSSDMTRQPLPAEADRLQFPLVDASPALAANGTGIVTLEVQAGTQRPGVGQVVTVRPAPLPSRAIVQVTNLGLTIHPVDSGVLVLVTALDTGRPVPGAAVTVLAGDAPLWRGTTDANGLARSDDGTATPGRATLVVVEHDGDHAFGEPADPPYWWRARTTSGRRPTVLTGVVFSDRGIYRPGETVSVKAIVRARTGDRIEALPPGTPLTLTLSRDGDAVTTLEARTTEGGGADWQVALAADAALDTYEVEIGLAPTSPLASQIDPEDDRWPSTSILVREMRPLAFEPSASMASRGRDTIALTVKARDLTEVPLARGRVAWKLHHIEALPSPEVPEAFRSFEFGFGGLGSGAAEIGSGTGDLVDGIWEDVVTRGRPGDAPGSYYLAGEVVDAASSQSIAFSERFVWAPDIAIGVARPAAFPRGAFPATVQVVALDPQGRPVPGVPVTVALPAVPADGTPEVSIAIVTGAEPIPVVLPARDWTRPTTIWAHGTDTSRSILGTRLNAWDGQWTPWRKPDASVIVQAQLDRTSYAVGDVAHLSLASSLPHATVLVTVERDLVYAAYVVELAGAPRIIDVPVVEGMLGGASLTITGVKGRTGACCETDGLDPGAPAVQMTQLDLEVAMASARLGVTVTPSTSKPMAGSRTGFTVAVHDAGGRPAPDAEVTLWAVDEGWLRQVDYRLPEIADVLIRSDTWVWPTSDSRLAFLRRAMPPPRWFDQIQTSTERSSAISVQGGEDAAVRTDLRPLAFWFGALRTGPDGVADVETTLPDTLTTYRVMAVATTRARFGQVAQPLVVARPLMLRTALPRALSRGDRATLRVTVASLLATPARGAITVESLTPELLAVDGEVPAVRVAPGGRETVSVALRALASGLARLRVRVASAEGADALEQSLPIAAPAVIERAASSGLISDAARETIRMPADRDPLAGGLSVEVSTSLLAGVSLAGRDLDGYAYLCLEQRASRALALGLAAKLGGPFAFTPAGRDSTEAALARALRELTAYRCTDRNGYGLWNGGACRVSSPYLAPYVLFTLQTLRGLDIAIDQGEIDHAVAAIEASLAAPTTATAAEHTRVSEGWRAFAVKVLADERRFPANAAERLLTQVDALPVWGVAHLYDALREAAPSHAALPDLRRRLTNAITPAGATAHVEERADLFDWTWPSAPKTTAIVLDVLARRHDLEPVRGRALASWLLQARRAGVWHSTQENAWALIALASYHREVEGAITDPVTVGVRLDGTTLIDAALDGEHDPTVRHVPTPELVPLLGPSRTGDVTFSAKGERPAFYTTRVETHRPAESAPPLEHGILVTRRYEVADGDALRPVTTVGAGEVVQVTLTIRTPEGRFLVALSDPLPGGFEAIDPTLASTPGSSGRYWTWGGSFDHIELRDARVDLFASYLPPGEHTISYLARATTPGTFFAAPTHAEAMYEPEVAGRGAGTTITVTAAP